MTYLELYRALRAMERISPEKLDDTVWVVGRGKCFPISRGEYNDGSTGVNEGVKPHQYLLEGII